MRWVMWRAVSARPYLLGEGKARSVSLATDSFAAIEKQFPYVVTAGVKNDKINYPSEILARHLYLGNWEHASNKEALKAQRIKHVVTIHNNPAGITVAKTVTHTQLGAADVPTENITKHFEEAFAAIDKAAELGERVLVHCGGAWHRVPVSAHPDCLLKVYR